MSSSSGHSSKYAMFESLAKGLLSSSTSASSSASSQHGAPGTQPAAAAAGAATTVSSGHSSAQQKGTSLTDWLPLVEGASRRVMARKSAGAPITSEEVMKAFQQELVHQVSSGSGGMTSMMKGTGGKGAAPAGVPASGSGAYAPAASTSVPGMPVPGGGGSGSGSGSGSGIPGLGGPLPGPLAGHDKEVNMACNMLLEHYKLPPLPMAATTPAAATAGMPQAAGAGGAAGMGGAGMGTGMGTGMPPSASAVPVPHAAGGYPRAGAMAGYGAGYGSMPSQAGYGSMPAYPASGYPPAATGSTMFPQAPPHMQAGGFAPDAGAMYSQLPYAAGVPYSDPMTMAMGGGGYPQPQAMMGSYPQAAPAYAQQQAAGQAYPGPGAYYTGGEYRGSGV